MKLYYVTLNTAEEAQTVSRALLKQQLAVCVNWFPITCAYRWGSAITEEPEVVLLINTQSGLQPEIEKVIQTKISVTNFIAEISPNFVNQAFLDWLNQEVLLDLLK